jgi:thymidylate synthase
MNIEHDYLKLLKDILENGVEKQDRTGTGTISVFGRQIRHDMSKGFPLLTTKKMYWKGIVTELLWFLRGDTNIKYLVDNNCHIWDGDCYRNYEILMLGNPPEKILNFEEFIEKIKTDDEFAKKWGDLGPIYGKQWVNWETYFDPSNNWKPNSYNQIKNLINDLKTNPDSRRLMVSAWNVGELNQMVLPPCHYGFQVYTRELTPWERMKISKDYGNTNSIEANWDVSEGLIDNMCDKWGVPTRAISLMWNQRSVDTFLGLPFNIASYGLLLEIIAKEVNMVPDELIGNLGDVHLYKNHVDQAKEQLSEIPWEERREMLTDPSDIREFGNISPFTDKMINYWPKLGELPDYLCMKDNWECYEPSDFTLENYQSHPPIKAPLSN